MTDEDGNEQRRRKTAEERWKEGWGEMSWEGRLRK